MTTDVQNIVNALLQHKNVLLYGPPGTGKSHLMQEVASHFHAKSEANVSKIVTIDTAEERQPFSSERVSGISSRWVTFHQGYSYEDFILGMRPITNSTGGFSIIPRPGVLLELAAQARQGGSGLLLIDEINRGNTSRIFGEFITLMEQDKRLDEQGEHTATTVTITLPYLAPGETVEVSTINGTEAISREFSMPAKIYTLASMNSVDKSISPMDTALRRRFHIIKLSPTRSAILESVGLAKDTSLQPVTEPSTSLTAQNTAVLAATMLVKLNRGIGLYLGNDFMLGQWYLAPLNRMDDEAARTTLVETWLYRILPQLLELFHGRDEQLIALLGTRLIKSNDSGLMLFEPDDEESEYGATSYVEIASPTPERDQVLDFLLQFVIGDTRA